MYDELVDDYANFVTLNKALIGIGVAEKDVKAVFQTVVAVLHLGNILFKETSDGSTGLRFFWLKFTLTSFKNYSIYTG